MKRKGIVLAGGTGSRLFPATKIISKQLLPIYDKPMIYYPLATLMLAGIKEIIIVTTPRDIDQYKKLLGKGQLFGISIDYAIQDEPKGIAHGLLVAEEFIGNDNLVLILGDNLFYGTGLVDLLKSASNNENGATIFSYHVNDPERYGVVEYDKKGKVKNITEKPKHPNSNFVVTGLYFYDKSVFKYIKSLKFSKRNELEITDLNSIYLKNNKLYVKEMSRGFTWLDTGTIKSFMEASNFVQTLEERQGLKIGCPEEVALKNGWISKSDLQKIINNSGKNQYNEYLLRLISEK